jgi:hypothetical protein
MKKYYFTFGQNHMNPLNGKPLKDYWVEVVAKNKRLAREKMFDEFGNRWANQYDETNFDSSYFSKGCYREFIVKDKAKETYLND